MAGGRGSGGLAMASSSAEVAQSFGCGSCPFSLEVCIVFFYLLLAFLIGAARSVIFGVCGRLFLIGTRRLRVVVAGRKSSLAS